MRMISKMITTNMTSQSHVFPNPIYYYMYLAKHMHS